jgi:hypothetical protein
MHHGHEMFRKAGKSVLEGAELQAALAESFKEHGFDKSVFCIDDTTHTGPVKRVTFASGHTATIRHLKSDDHERQHQIDRFNRLESETAKIELRQREAEHLDTRARFALAMAVRDAQAQNELLPRMKEIWALEAKAAGAAPRNRASFSDEEATRRARTILTELGHDMSGGTAMREPELSDRRSRGVAVAAGDAEGTFRRGATSETISEEEATERAAKILRELGHEPNRAS